LKQVFCFLLYSRTDTIIQRFEHAGYMENMIL